MMTSTTEREAVTDADALFRVEWRHNAIHSRLENWGKWNRGGRRVGGVSAPMFRLYRSSDARSREPRSAGIAPDELDALDVEHAVAALPEGPREVVRWSYVTPYVSGGKVARYLSVRMAELPVLLHEGRELLRISLRA
jgi:hypothetical protein